jgi:hypothetical protein
MSYTNDAQGPLYSGGIDRSSLYDEAQQPAVQNKIASMIQGEVGLGAPLNSQRAMLETLTNRALARRTSLWTELNNGYYPSKTFQNTVTPQWLSTVQNDIYPHVFGGSNFAQGATGNASSTVAQHQYQKGTPGFNIPAAGGQSESLFNEEAHRGWKDTIGGQQTAYTPLQPKQQSPMSNTYLSQALGGQQRPPLDAGNLSDWAQAFTGNQGGGGMSPLERAGIYLMSIGNPSALSGLSAGSRDAEQRNQMLMRMLGMNQNQQNHDQQELARRMKPTEISDPSQANLITGSNPKPPTWQAEGLENPYAGLPTYAHLEQQWKTGGRPQQGGQPQQTPQPQQAAQPQMAPQGSPQMAPQMAPQGPQAPQMAPQGAPQTLAPEQPIAPQAAVQPQMAPEVPRWTEMTSGGAMKMANDISRYVGKDRDPDKVKAVMDQLATDNPEAHSYLQGVMNNDIDPSFTRADKMAPLYSALNQMLPGLTGKNAAAFSKDYAMNEQFNKSAMGTSVPGSPGYLLNSIETFAKQGRDLNEMFSALKNTTGVLPSFLQQGIGINIPYVGHVGNTPNENMHLFGDDAARAQGFDAYAQTYGREVMNFLLRGKAGGAAEERSMYGQQFTSNNTPPAHYEQMLTKDREGRTVLESARDAVASEFGENSQFYKKWMATRYATAKAALDETKADTERRYAPGGTYYQENPHATIPPDFFSNILGRIGRGITQGGAYGGQVQ